MLRGTYESKAHLETREDMESAFGTFVLQAGMRRDEAGVRLLWHV